MSTTILVGAGAEVDLGLPSGEDYLVDTYLTKKRALYQELRGYYSAIKADNSVFPSYQSEFLFNKASATFRQLIDNLGDNAVAAILADVSAEELREAGKPSRDQEERLFNALIDSEDSPLQEHMQANRDRFANGKYYGILESLFACLVNPLDNPSKFWRLINFYWSAYFSIVLPLLESEYSQACGIIPDYGYVLNHLDYVSEVVASEPYWNSLNRESYYHTGKGRFDYVLTTNYTPFCSHLTKSPNRVAWLSGSILQFESAEDFELYEPQAVSGTDREVLCPFPYMMAKAPVKPIINVEQIEVYHRATAFLNDTRLLVVLGYSFNQDDAHICALIRHYLLKRKSNRILYLSYVPEGINPSKSTGEDVLRELAACLRVSSEVIRLQCEVRFITNCRSDAFLEAVRNDK